MQPERYPQGKGDDSLRDAVVDSMEYALAANCIVTPFTSEASLLTDIAALEHRFASSEWLWRR
jgi:hypothetical protein